MLRLAVPSVQPDEAPCEEIPGQQQRLPVRVVGMDLAGVPTPPFSASLLAGDRTTCCFHTASYCL